MASEITQLLEECSRGNANANEQLFNSVYRELRTIAHAHRRKWHGNETLNTTAIIHEAWIKLADSEGSYKNRGHFYATAAKAMHQILVNYAIKSRAAKRQAESANNEIPDITGSYNTLDELLMIDRLLQQIADESERRYRIIECRVFGGMSIDETAEALQISPATVKRDWALLSAWLYRELKLSSPPVKEQTTNQATDQ